MIKTASTQASQLSPNFHSELGAPGFNLEAANQKFLDGCSADGVAVSLLVATWNVILGARPGTLRENLSLIGGKYLISFTDAKLTELPLRLRLVLQL